MAGHSKWKNIMHKKEKTDAQRAKVFTKIGKEMSIAVKEGGTNPESNSKLKDLIAKAKSFNVPNDNIERIIKKAGSDDSARYENINYEGYGPNGIAVIAECATDNRNRTSGDIRHYFDKFGGNLGASGCVTYMFSEKGVIVIPAGIKTDEDKLMEDILESGASDFTKIKADEDDEIYQIFTEPASISSARAELESRGYVILSSEVEMLPSVYVKLDKSNDADSIIKINKLLEHLEEHDDVINIWHNWEIDN
ncbi:MAG: YebC/PmpR family DNA-binding transcriptional regulator [Oscillospiraceae bacterium]|nr:YebC/PmpR family DNA-binding transcriptional regulator [Oscillospiraceae bacterium]